MGDVLPETLTLISIVGIILAEPHIKNIGFYALSGALTNWLAIYMLFEKIPFLYGSGIIPNKFNSFKKAIKEMIMGQFFSQENIAKFLSKNNVNKLLTDKIASNIDYNKIFDSFVDMLMSSQYGSMIDMFLGGKGGLENLRKPFVSKINDKVNDLVNNIDIDEEYIASHLAEKVESIIDARLDELTPLLVKNMIQKIIREHLGWLVVWGGVFGGVIGLIASCIV